MRSLVLLILLSTAAAYEGARLDAQWFMRGSSPRSICPVIESGKLVCAPLTTIG